MAIYEKDMATSRSEFFRNLAIALEGMDYVVEGDRVRVDGEERQVGIVLSALPARVLSPLLKLERWKVTIVLDGFPAAAEQAFMARFDQVFQRGGG